MNDHNVRSCARILMVDDDWRLIRAANTKLNSMGFICIAYDNVSEAMSHFLTYPIDLVITDLSMPNIDGLGMIGLIRHQSNVPIIVVTGQQDGGAQILRDYPDILVLRKPCQFERLIEAVHSFVPCRAS